MAIRSHWLRASRDAVLGRFPNTKLLQSLSNLFDPHSLPDDDKAISSRFGMADLKTVLLTWGPLVDQELALSQWASCPRQLLSYKVLRCIFN